MKTTIKSILFASFLPICLYSQTDRDALRYSMINFGGTARYSSMGGAFGAIGSDFSVLSTNPAGLGTFRKSQYTFTPSLYSSKSNSIYNNSSGEDAKFNFNISNFGMIAAFNNDKKDEKEGWKFVNFGFGVNRYNNFHNRAIIKGENKQSSLIDIYKNASQGKSIDELDPFTTGLAFQTYLLDSFDGNHYFSNVPSGGLMQRKNIESSGAMQEWVISLAANYNNKFYLGGTIGIPSIRYFEKSSYSEIDQSDSFPDFDNFTLSQDLVTRGNGYNFKFGIIYVPVDIEMLKIKIGAAVHSPTTFLLHDEWSSQMSAEFDTISFSSNSPKGKYDYELNTPMRAIGSLSVQIGKYGVIGVDYEFVDYSDARFRSADDSYFDVNDNIKSKYTAQQNLRIGGELVLGLFSLRAGYAIYGSPYKENINNGSMNAITAGFGFVEKNYFIDFGYVYTEAKSDYYLYNLSTMKPANVTTKTDSFLMTLGFKF